jgi:YHS domain-containing protein
MAMAQVKDPVCGMTVDTGRAAGWSSFGGQMYYFCSRECLERFEADPARYASRSVQADSSAAADLRAEEAEPPYTKSGDIVAPKFGSAGSGGAEYERLPEAPRERLKR